MCFVIVSWQKIVPDAHVWAWDLWKTDGSRETLISLWVVVLETNLELDGLQEVTLLGLEGVVQELLDIGAHSGCKESSANRSFALPRSAANCANECAHSWLQFLAYIPTEILEAMIASLPIVDLLVRNCAVVS